jgi:hypothetical protein
MPPPAVGRWPSQAQRSDTDPARPLKRAAATIPRGASVPCHAKPILHRAQGALAQATKQVLARLAQVLT